MKIVIATKNSHKAWEIYTMLKDLGIDIEDLDCHPRVSMPEEDQSTFKGNALKKAKAVAEQTRLPALADDSGLEVDALSGRPGIFSARYSGENATDADNNKKLLKELKGIPFQKRSAHYTCVIAFVDPSGYEATFQGRCDGIIALEEKGEGGFGYDPLFYLPRYKKTMAELTADEKNRISHRAKALVRLRKHLSAIPRDSGEKKQSA